MPLTRQNAMADIRHEYPYLKALSHRALRDFAIEHHVPTARMSQAKELLLRAVCDHLEIETPARTPPYGRPDPMDDDGCPPASPTRSSPRSRRNTPYVIPPPRVDLNTRRRAAPEPEVTGQPDEGAINAPTPESSPEPDDVDRRGPPASEESLRQTVDMLAEFRRRNEELARECDDAIRMAVGIRGMANDLQQEVAVQRTRRQRLERYLVYWRSERPHWGHEVVFPPDMPVFLRRLVEQRSHEAVEVDAIDADLDQELQKYMDKVYSEQRRTVGIAEDASPEALYDAFRTNEDELDESDTLEVAQPPQAEDPESDEMVHPDDNEEAPRADGVGLQSDPSSGDADVWPSGPSSASQVDRTANFSPVTTKAAQDHLREILSTWGVDLPSPSPGPSSTRRRSSSASSSHRRSSSSQRRSKRKASDAGIGDPSNGPQPPVYPIILPMSGEVVMHLAKEDRLRKKAKHDAHIKKYLASEFSSPGPRPRGPVPSRSRPKRGSRAGTPIRASQPSHLTPAQHHLFHLPAIPRFPAEERRPLSESARASISAPRLWDWKVDRSAFEPVDPPRYRPLPLPFSVPPPQEPAPPIAPGFRPLTRASRYPRAPNRQVAELNEAFVRGAVGRWDANLRREADRLAAAYPSPESESPPAGAGADLTIQDSAQESTDPGSPSGSTKTNTL